MSLFFKIGKKSLNIYTGMILLISASILCTKSAFSENVSVDNISPYYCNQIGGASSGRNCVAPYKQYSGNACGIYNGIVDKYAELSKWFAATTQSCSPATVLEAKKKTLKYRADLRGYVSLGRDESVNDPVVNRSLRPGNPGPPGPAEAYFAAECAVRQCSSGEGGGHQSSEGEPENEKNELKSTNNSPKDDDKLEKSKDKDKGLNVKICSRDDTDVFLSIKARKAGAPEVWFVMGWWKISPKDCVQIGGILKGRFYTYAYTVNKAGKIEEWSGHHPACTRDHAYMYISDGSQNCKEHMIKNFYEHNYDKDENFVWNLEP